MARPENPHVPYYVFLQDAERRLLSAALLESSTIAEAADRLGISVTWYRTRCVALGIPVLLTAGTQHLKERPPDPRPPLAPTPRTGPRSEAQLAASRRNLEKSERYQSAQAKKRVSQDKSTPTPPVPVVSENVGAGVETDDAYEDDETSDWEP